jgi:transposase
MKKASIIGLDLAKRSFQAHGALADGSVAFRKKLTREKVLGFLAEQPAAPSPWRPAGAPITGVGLSPTPGMKFA